MVPNEIPFFSLFSNAGRSLRTPTRPQAHQNCPSAAIERSCPAEAGTTACLVARIHPDTHGRHRAGGVCSHGSLSFGNLCPHGSQPHIICGSCCPAEPRGWLCAVTITAIPDPCTGMLGLVRHRQAVLLCTWTVAPSPWTCLQKLFLQA